MLVTPMIDSWQPPRIERVRALESRRLTVLPVIGLSGDLVQDLGRGALRGALVLHGTCAVWLGVNELAGDRPHRVEAREHSGEGGKLARDGVHL